MAFTISGKIAALNARTEGAIERRRRMLRKKSEEDKEIALFTLFIQLIKESEPTLTSISIFYKHPSYWAFQATPESRRRLT